MKTNNDIANEIDSHYSSGYEKDRLKSDSGKLEEARVQYFLEKYLPPPPAKILDVGGAAGVYAYWLAKKGYEVHLLDISDTHVRLAKEAAPENPDHHLKSIQQGDARKLDFKKGSFDAVLMFGPLYHLTKQKDRIKALKEAKRVLKKKGVLLAQVISKYASLLDGMRSGFLNDPEFMKIVLVDLETGQHRNTTGKPEYFMDTFFHSMPEFNKEMKEAGFSKIKISCVEGPFWLMRNFESFWNKEKEFVMRVLEQYGSDVQFIGMSGHLIGRAAK